MLHGVHNTEHITSILFAESAARPTVVGLAKWVYRPYRIDILFERGLWQGYSMQWRTKKPNGTGR